MMEIMDKKTLTLKSFQYWSNSGVQENSLLLELSLSSNRTLESNKTLETHLVKLICIIDRVVASSTQIVPKQAHCTVNANYPDL